jgi:hypothetical protein
MRRLEVLVPDGEPTDALVGMEKARANGEGYSSRTVE